MKVAIIITIICTVMGYSCCVVSGECSREEERMMQEGRIPDDSRD